jgi:hypothetical protein
MSTGIEVWITGGFDQGGALLPPCTVNLLEWKVCVFDCCRPGEGPVQLCEDTSCKPTQCGHVHFNVPPGCYFLIAWGPGGPTGGVVTVGCGQEACVTLVSVNSLQPFF